MKDALKKIKFSNEVFMVIPAVLNSFKNITKGKPSKMIKGCLKF